LKLSPINRFGTRLLYIFADVSTLFQAIFEFFELSPMPLSWQPTDLRGQIPAF